MSLRSVSCLWVWLMFKVMCICSAYSWISVVIYPQLHSSLNNPSLPLYNIMSVCRQLAILRRRKAALLLCKMHFLFSQNWHQQPQLEQRVNIHNNIKRLQTECVCVKVGRFMFSSYACSRHCQQCKVQSLRLNHLGNTVIYSGILPGCQSMIVFVLNLHLLVLYTPPLFPLTHYIYSWKDTSHPVCYHNIELC